MGLASAWALARAGASVQLFERRTHIHEHGSHGGYTRVIRHAYHEGSDYVALVSEADRMWSALAERVDQQLLVRCGLLEFGAPDDPDFLAALAALREHDINHQLLDAADARARYGFEIPSSWPACLSPGSGYLRVRPCLDALRQEAEGAGVTLRHESRVRELILGGERPRILLEDGSVVASDRVVVAAGAGAGQLLGKLVEVEVLRRVLAWTRPPQQAVAALRALPVWAGFVPEGFFYGFPLNDEGISGFKLACHVSSDPRAAFMNEAVNPERVEREIQARDLDPLRQFLDHYRPDAGDIVETRTCLYTNTPSGDFIVDLHPQDSRFVIAAGFSGHGFKFAPAIGAAVSDLAHHGHSSLALARFRLQ